MKLIAGILLALGLSLTGCAQTETDVSAIKVTRVIDGDTIVLEDGHKVRIIGIDAPERGCPGYKKATDDMKDMVLGKRVVLVAGNKNDTDRWDRLLRYVEIGTKDIGYEQILKGNADARYDSTDNYPKHMREEKYHAADTEKNVKCK